MKLSNSTMKNTNLFRWHKQLALFLLIFTITVSGAWAQKSITGYISDSENNPLPGVNVTIKGTLTGTISDLDGNYSIEVNSEADVLVYSMMGMLTLEIEVGSQSEIDIQMEEDLIGLDEIVVVGYGTMKKTDVTGSIVSIKEEDFSQVKTINVVEGLQGKAAGVDISRSSGEAGSDFSISIRGERSLSGNNKPLYIVDGIQYGSGIDINPSDIASIEILKDVSSTAIYGAKGANGVVIITTKKGIEGKTKVTFSTYHSWNTPLGELPYMNSSEYLQFKEDLAKFEEYYNTGEWPDEVDVTLKPFEQTGVDNGTDTRWIDEISRTGHLRNYFLSVAGGKAGFTYNLSLDHTNESGMLDKDEFKRYVIRGGFDVKVTDWLNIGTNSILSYRDRSRMNFPEKRIRQQSPLAVPYDSTGELLTNPTPSLDAVTPLWYFEEGYYENQELKSRIFSSVYADFQILNGLKLRTTLNADLSTSRNGKSEKAGEANTNVEMWISPSRDITWSNILTFDKTFGMHHFQITGVHEFKKENQERYRISGINPVIPDSRWYALDGMDEISVTLDPDKEGDDRLPYTESNLLSFMGRVNYTLMSKYILTASVRTDRASQLADGNKWAYFPALSVGWNLRQENFIQSIDLVSSMKLRLGYGVSGNYHVPVYSSIDQTNTSPLYYEFGTSESVSFGYRPVFAGNPNLTWETTAAYNFGFDFGIIDNRISGNVDVYKANTTSLLQDRKLPAHAAIPSIYDNIGEVETKGVELMLHTVNVSKSGDGFKWSTDISFTRNREKILEIASGVTEDVSNGWFVDHPIRVFYDYERTGNWQFADSVQMGLFNDKGAGYQYGDIKLVDQTGDTLITEADRIVVGSRRPDWYGSFNNRFEYKGFDLSVMIMARMGHMIKDNVMTQSQVRDDYGENGMAVDYWTPVNPTNESPRPDPSFSSIALYPNSSTLTYTDGSWVKVRDITLGYSLPTEFLGRAGISSLRVYASLKNYFVLYSPFYNKGRYDPEMNDDTDPKKSGLGTKWPVPKTIMVGLNLEF